MGERRTTKTTNEEREMNEEERDDVERQRPIPVPSLAGITRTPPFPLCHHSLHAHHFPSGPWVCVIKMGEQGTPLEWRIQRPILEAEWLARCRVSDNPCLRSLRSVTKNLSVLSWPAPFFPFRLS